MEEKAKDTAGTAAKEKASTLSRAMPSHHSRSQ